MQDQHGVDLQDLNLGVAAILSERTLLCRFYNRIVSPISCDLCSIKFLRKIPEHYQIF